MTSPLGPRFEKVILSATGASGLSIDGIIQDLWSGYGRILRLALQGGTRPSVIVKHVSAPTAARHPRGWNSDQSHQRKLTSYQIETTWYREWSGRCGFSCRVPEFIAFDEHEGEFLIVLEDLDAAGFPLRRQSVSWSQIEACLSWLANFHATFMGAAPEGLWRIGTYWHLDTRHDELDALEDLPLKQAASAIDGRLSQARHQTIVHGDAKLANFCFPDGEGGVAAVDFQYVGGGCGAKDLAYFIGSCLDEASCEERESDLLDSYFASLRHALAAQHPEMNSETIEAEWRELFPFAWTDFHRFLKGWSPGHWKINSYSERLAREVVEMIRERP